jgi:hypothetical protein
LRLRLSPPRAVDLLLMTTRGSIGIRRFYVSTSTVFSVLLNQS